MQTTDDDDEGAIVDGANRRVLVRGFAGGERPLQQCVAWIEKQQPYSYVAFAHEIPSAADPARIVRRYEARAVDGGLAEWARPRTDERHAHEVLLRGPCRLYLDVDVSLHCNEEQATAVAADALVQRVTEFLRIEYGVDTRVTTLDATRPGEKFSRHVIGRLTDVANGGPVAFASVVDCGHIVRASGAGVHTCRNADGEDVPMYDAAVYRENGTFRLYGSTKYGQQRPLVPLGEECAAALDMRMLRDTLVCIDPTVPGLRLLASPNRLRVSSSGSKRRLTTPSPPVVGDAARRLADSEAAIAGAGILSVVRLGEDGGLLLVKCTSQFCERKGAAHEFSTIYFLMAPELGTYRQHCYADGCKDRAKPRWRRFSTPAGLALCEELAPSRRARTYRGGIDATIKWRSVSR